MSKWLAEQESIDTLIGLGGNIKAFLNLNKSKRMSSKDLIKNANNLKGLNVDEKIEKYNLPQDRADVIDYAMIIFERIINQLKIKEIRSTKWGVSDSIAVKTFNELYSKKISIYKD
jgi:exopolyphosphatase/guanosine-5'-triphosphate,3'-diphosphate pyrophosphatase